MVLVWSRRRGSLGSPPPPLILTDEADAGEQGRAWPTRSSSRICAQLAADLLLLAPYALLPNCRDGEIFVCDWVMPLMCCFYQWRVSNVAAANAYTQREREIVVTENIEI